MRVKFEGTIEELRELFQLPSLATRDQERLVYINGRGWVDLNKALSPVLPPVSAVSEAAEGGGIPLYGRGKRQRLGVFGQERALALMNCPMYPRKRIIRRGGSDSDSYSDSTSPSLPGNPDLEVADVTPNPDLEVADVTPNPDLDVTPPPRNPRGLPDLVRVENYIKRYRNVPYTNILTGVRVKAAELAPILKELVEQKKIKKIIERSIFSRRESRRYVYIGDAVLESVGFQPASSGSVSGSESDLEVNLEVDSPSGKLVLPAWVKGIKNREKRSLVEQEYYINPDLARRFAEECETAEDIRALRKELADNKLYGASSIHAAWAEE